MLKSILARPFLGLSSLFQKKLSRSAVSLGLIFLLIEFFDELHYAIGGAALPAMRADLALSYAQVGLLLGLPHITGTLIEPALLLLGDTRLRKTLVVGGGLAIVLALVLTAITPGFALLLAAAILAFPASGAFVSLSQATLMDQNPGQEAEMMARWTVAGSAGTVIGPLLLSAGLAMALGWRWAFAGLSVLALLLVLLLLPRRFPVHPEAGHTDNLVALLKGLLNALRDPAFMRWILLLVFSDLLLDGFFSYLPLYYTDAIGLTPAQASIMLAVLMVANLVSDVVLIPLLERFHGRKVVRVSAALAILVYSAWLLAPWLWLKVIFMAIIPFTTMGWYQVLQGEAFAAMPGRSGTVSAVGSLSGLLNGALMWLIGAAAGFAGLSTAMWLLLLGPLVLLVFVPRLRA